jgi:hypothetical protein
MVVERDPQPAASLVVRAPSQGAWSLAGFAWSPAPPADNTTTGLRMRAWQDGSHWSAEWQTPHGELTVSRSGEQLKLAGAVDAVLALQRADDGRAAQDDARNALNEAARTYRRFPEFVTYREKVTVWLLVAFVAQVLVLTLLQVTPWRDRRALHVALYTVWCAGTAWLGLIYFA